MNLVVGNRVTYEYNGKTYQEIMGSNNDIEMFKDSCQKFNYEILKVEACNWETIEFVEE